MAFLISRCFDSHVHWPELGEIKSYFDLSKIRFLDSDFSQLVKTCRQPQRGDWFIGFGWDDNKWSGEDQKLFGRKFLDRYFPNHPALMIRADGHASAVNSIALKRAAIPLLNPPEIVGGRHHVDANGEHLGLLVDSAKFQVDAILPKINHELLQKHMLLGQEEFKKAGFTHIRDMGFNQTKWDVVVKLEQKKLLELYVEANFAFEVFSEFEQTLFEAIKAKTEKHNFLRVVGIKFYIDGALGSEGALISQPYKSGKKGLQLFESQQIEYILEKCWSQGMPVAVHALGDLASTILANAALSVYQRTGTLGELNLEHAEVLNPETIRKLSSLKTRLHFQPCHYLTDRKFLHTKLGEREAWAFNWTACEELGMPIFFGSDAPIEPPSLLANKEAYDLLSSQGKILKRKWFSYHSHPDSNWGPLCETQLNSDQSIVRKFI